MINALAEEYLRTRSEAAPLWATFLGVTGFDDQLPDASAEGEAAMATRLRDLAARAEAVEVDGLSDSDRVTRSVLRHEAVGLAEQLEDAHTEFFVNGPFAPLPQLFLAVSMTSSPDDVVGRLRGVPAFLAQIGERYREGAQRGRGPQVQGLRQAIDQVEGYLALPLDQDPLVKQAGDSARELVSDQVRPAMQSLLDVLRGPVTDGARGDDRPGLVHVPDGEATYLRALANHTTTSRTPDEIHQAGLDLCAELREEYAQLGSSVFGTSDVTAVIDRLRNDEGLRYTNATEMLADARDAITRAEQVLPQWFGTFQEAPCEVEPMSDLEAPGGVLGRYLPAAPDGSRPAYHLLNTHQPHSRTRYEYETLAFHESVPGHHTQLAVSQELSDTVPDFRRFGYIAGLRPSMSCQSLRTTGPVGRRRETNLAVTPLRHTSEVASFAEGRVVVNVTIPTRAYIRVRHADRPSG